MIYVLTEDAESGAKFWNLLSDIFETQERITVIPTCGNKNMLRAIAAFNSGSYTKPAVWVNTIKRKDGEIIEYQYYLEKPTRIILAFDKLVPDKGLFRAIRKLAIPLSQRYKSEIYFSRFGCIEELLLSFKYFRRLVRVKQLPNQMAILKAYKLFLICHQHGKNYKGNFLIEENGQQRRVRLFCSTNLEYVDELIYDFLNSVCAKDARRTTERTLAAILKHMTLGLDTSFDKENIGPCFSADCCQANVVNSCKSTYLHAKEWRSLCWTSEDIAPLEFRQGIRACDKWDLIFEHSDFKDCFEDRHKRTYSIKEVLTLKSPEQPPQSTAPATASLGQASDEILDNMLAKKLQPDDVLASMLDRPQNIMDPNPDGWRYLIFTTQGEEILYYTTTDIENLSVKEETTATTYFQFKGNDESVYIREEAARRGLDRHGWERHWRKTALYLKHLIRIVPGQNPTTDTHEFD